MAKNNQSQRGLVEKVISVCQVRLLNELNCRGCQYHGEICTQTIEYLKNEVTRPTEIKLNKEAKKI